MIQQMIVGAVIAATVFGYITYTVSEHISNLTSVIGM